MKHAGGPTKNPQGTLVARHLRVVAPCELHAKPVEAEGIEPSSQDNRNGGLYMLIRCFDLDRDAGHRHSSSRSSCLFLAARPTTESRSQPFFFSQRFTDVSAVPTLPGLSGSDCERSAEADAAADITVIGS